MADSTGTSTTAAPHAASAGIALDTTTSAVPVQPPHPPASPAAGSQHMPSAAPPDRPDASRDFRHRLFTPTQIVRLQRRYFIVDCWHHRILHSPVLDAPLTRWQTLDEDIAGPHSIASDGTLYVTEDTGRHGLRVYRETSPGRFEQVQYLGGIGQRPHRTIHDAAHQQFLVIGSEDQSLHAFVVRNGQLEQTQATRVSMLHGQYCRSITLLRDQLHFVGENSIVIHTLQGRHLLDDGRRLPLAEGCRGSNDLFFLDGQRGILTCTPGRAFLFEDLRDLVRGTALDLSPAFAGTPYYISRFDGRLWIPEITEHSAIRSYPGTPSASGLGHARTLFDDGPPTAASQARKAILPA